MQQEYWDRFISVHSPKTCEYVQSILGKNVELDEFIKAHQETCQSENYSPRRCGKRLFEFLNKFHYVNTDASSEH